MKISILMLTLSTTILISSCESASDKVKEEQEHLEKAKKDLDQANFDYLVDIENFKIAETKKMESNDKKIADLRLKILNDKIDSKENEEKIAELELKNKNLQQKMNDYRGEGKENWVKFKAEFKHDMDEFGKAFKDLTVKNTK